MHIVLRLDVVGDIALCKKKVPPSKQAKVHEHVAKGRRDPSFRPSPGMVLKGEGYRVSSDIPRRGIIRSYRAEISGR